MKKTTRYVEIASAWREFESCLIILRDHFKVKWIHEGFKVLRTLIKLARNKPRRGKK